MLTTFQHVKICLFCTILNNTTFSLINITKNQTTEQQKLCCTVSSSCMGSTSPRRYQGWWEHIFFLQNYVFVTVPALDLVLYLFQSKARPGIKGTACLWDSTESRSVKDSKGTLHLLLLPNILCYALCTTAVLQLSLLAWSSSGQKTLQSLSSSECTCTTLKTWELLKPKCTLHERQQALFFSPDNRCASMILPNPVRCNTFSCNLMRSALFWPCLEITLRGFTPTRALSPAGQAGGHTA